MLLALLKKGEKLEKAKLSLKGNEQISAFGVIFFYETLYSINFGV